MKLRFIILLLVFLLPQSVFASSCSSNGYTVLTVNGIFTDLAGAKANSFALSYKLKNQYNNQPLKVDYIYNPSHLAGLGDLVDTVQQGLFEQKSDYDLEEMLNDASQKVTTQKVLLVAHSQGNFYANNFYDKTASQPGGIPSQSISMYGVASPANRVAGDGKYLTSDTDGVIASTVSRFLKILQPNIHIPLLEGDDKNGHNFSEVYLKYQGDRIVSDIKSTLNNLKENDEQESEDPCISPPELSILHKVQGVAFAMADPTAIVVKDGAIATYDSGVYVATGLYNAGKAIANTTIQIANATASSIFSLAKSLSGTVGKLAGNNSAAVILADDESADTAQSSLGSSTMGDAVPEPAKKNPSSKNLEINTQATPVYEDVVVNDSTQATNEIIPVTETVPVLDENKKENVEDKIPEPVIQIPVSYAGSVGTVPPPVPDIPDTTVPEITLLGASSVTIEVGISYADAGATALDDVDGNITAKIVAVNPVDTSVVADYTITYNVKDAAKNSATQVTRLVHITATPPPPDTTPPVITLVGDATVTIIVGGTYTDAGATANDNIDGDITANIVTVNSVDVNTIGDYTITYNVKDAKLNLATQVTRLVHIVHSNILYSQLDYSTEISWGAVSSFDSFTGKSGHIRSIKFAYNDYGNSAGHFIGVSVVDRTDSINYYGATEDSACGDTYESTGLNTKTIIELESFIKYKAYPCTGPELTLNPTHTYGISLFRNHGGVDTQRFYGSNNSNDSVYLSVTDDTFPDISKSIRSFSFPELASTNVIDDVNHTVDVTVPFGTDVTALTPVIRISGNASISPNNNVVQNFTNPITYVVTAENGLSQSYTVTVLIHSKVIYSQSDNSVEITADGNVSLQNVFTSASGNISNLKFSYNDHGNSAEHFMGVKIIDQNTGLGYYAVKSGFSCGSAYESLGIGVPTIVTLDDTFQYKQYPCTGANLVLEPTHTYGVNLFRNGGGSPAQRFYGSSNTNNATYLEIETNGVAVPDPGPTKLKIITSPQTIVVDTESDVIKIESQNVSEVLTNVASTTDVNLSSSSDTGLFASSPASGPCDNDGTGWEKNKKITISTGDAHRHFCYKDITAGTPTITISATGLTSDSQTLTVTSP